MSVPAASLISVAMISCHTSGVVKKHKFVLLCRIFTLAAGREHLHNGRCLPPTLRLAGGQSCAVGRVTCDVPCDVIFANISTYLLFSLHGRTLA